MNNQEELKSIANLSELERASLPQAEWQNVECHVQRMQSEAQDFRDKAFPGESNRFPDSNASKFLKWREDK